MSGRLAAVLVVLGIASAGPSGAATLRVEAGTTYTTIIAAIAAADEGDTISVAPGEHVGNLDLGGLTLTIEGDDRSTVEIRGSGSGPAVTIGANSAIILRSLSISDGDARTGDGYGGCLSVVDSNPVIQDVRFHGCAANDGGCVSLVRSEAELTGVIVRTARPSPRALGTGDVATGADSGSRTGWS